ncbi:MAG: hypothetical protein EBR85_05205 [Betaproteobacteria bacterium]|nr:hypothetical protein [Betaproteobacteria bacterium]
MQAVEGLWIAQAMRESLWLYPTVETFHLWGIGALFGSILLVDLRLLGFARRLELRRLMHFAVPVTISGFTLAALTGFLMFIAHPSEFIASTLFVLKMTLLFLLGLNAISLHLRITPSPETSGLALPESSASIRLQAIVSILGWATVIGLGRWLAYV